MYEANTRYNTTYDRIGSTCISRNQLGSPQQGDGQSQSRQFTGNWQLQFWKSEKTPIYRAVEIYVRQAVPQGAVSEVILTKVESLAELQDFVQHLLSTLIKNQSFTVLINHLVKLHAQVIVNDVAKFYDQIVARANQDE